MKKRMFTIILAALMLLSVFAGCGSADSAVSSGSAENTTASVPEQEAAAAPLEEAETSAVIAEAAASSEEAEEPEEEIPDIQMPLANHDVTLSFWFEWPPFLDGTEYESPNDYMFFQTLSEVTGLDFEFTKVSMMSASEQFNLMVAAQSYDDIICATSYYSGSVDSAIESDIYLDVTDMLREYAPHYLELASRDENWRETFTEEGRVGVFYEISEEYYPPNAGPVIRQDWLNDVGMDVPETYDQMHDVLLAFKNQLDVECPAFMNDDFYFSYGYGFTRDFSNVDGKAVYSVTADGFKDYVTRMHQWYEEGLIFHDYYVYSSAMGQVDTVRKELGTSNQLGFWSAWCEDLAYYENDDPDYELSAMLWPVVNEGDSVHYDGPEPLVIQNSAWAISTSCDEEKVPLAMQMLDYLYTDEGALMANWGKEGMTFYYDENGDPHYTDLIMNNEKYMTNMAISLYCVFRGPIKSDKARFNQNVVGKIAEYCDVWNGADNDYVMPNVSMNAMDSEAYTALYSDVDTLLSENMPKFIIGDRPLSELDQFLAQLEEAGLSEMVEYEQQALDNYFSRKKPEV